MSEQLSQKQIIVATHSPPIGRDYLDLWIKVKLVPSEPKPREENNNNNDDNDHNPKEQSSEDDNVFYDREGDVW